MAADKHDESKADGRKQESSAGDMAKNREDDRVGRSVLKSHESSSKSSNADPLKDPQRAFLEFFLGLVHKRYHRGVLITFGACVALAAVIGVLQFVLGIVSPVAQEAWEIVFKANFEVPIEKAPKAQSDADPDEDAGRIEDLATVLSEKDEKKLESLIEDLPEERRLLKALCEATVALNRFNYRKVVEILPEDLGTFYSASRPEELLQGYKLRGMSLLRLKRPGASLRSFEKGLAVAPDDWDARAGRASSFVQLKKYSEAIEVYNGLLGPNNNLGKGKQYKFHLANAYNSRGIAYMRLYKFELASDNFSKALKLINTIESPDYQTLVTKGVILNSQGTTLIERAENWNGSRDKRRDMLAKAIELLTNGISVFKLDIETDLAVSNRSDLAMLYTNRSIAHAKLQDFANADKDVVAAIEIRRDLIMEGHDEFYDSLLNAYYNRAIVARNADNASRLVEACTEGIDTCVSIDTGEMKSAALRVLCDLHSLRSFAFERAGNLKGKIADSEQVLLICEQIDLKSEDLKYIYVTALNNIAWLCATSADEDFRDGERAVMLASKACEIDGDSDWGVVDTLACAYAERGYCNGQRGNTATEKADFEKAVQVERRALALLRNTTKANFDDGSEGERTIEEHESDVQYLKKLIALFRSREPYRDEENSVVQPNEHVNPPGPTDEIDNEARCWQDRVGAALVGNT